MNEMYNMSIVAHYYSVVAVFLSILLNFIMIILANDIKKYKRFMTLYNPIGGTFMGGIIFTGVVMMAAKHLDFTIENILMILIAIYMIILDYKRNKTLKIIRADDYSSFKSYKFYAMKMLVIQVLLLLAISVWMLI